MNSVWRRGAEFVDLWCRFALWEIAGGELVVTGFCGGCEIVCRQVVWFSRFLGILGLSLRSWRTLRVRFRGKRDCVKS